MNRIVTVLFLRVYAYNLGRSFRNSPDQAYADAMLQISIAVVPLIYTVLLAVVVLTGRANFMHLLDSKPLLIAGGLVIGLPLFYWIDRHFRPFIETPELAAPYAARRTRFVSSVGAVLIPLIWAAILGAAVFLYLHS